MHVFAIIRLSAACMDYKMTCPNTMTLSRDILPAHGNPPFSHATGLLESVWPRLCCYWCSCRSCTTSWSYRALQRCSKSRLGCQDLQRLLQFIQVREEFQDVVHGPDFWTVVIENLLLAMMRWRHSAKNSWTLGMDGVRLL